MSDTPDLALNPNAGAHVCACGVCWAKEQFPMTCRCGATVPAYPHHCGACKWWLLSGHSKRTDTAPCAKNAPIRGWTRTKRIQGCGDFRYRD